VVASYPSAKVRSNAELKNDIEAQFTQIFGFLYALLGVGIVASALGIANTMIMSVLERTREIGLIRAIGGTRRQLRGMIRRESILITLVGVVLGLAVGLAFGYVFVRASASQFPGLGFVVPWTTILVLLLGALVVAVVAAIMPARRATRINILRAVGFE
jgi:putative ABC transport system permease protein